MHKYGARGRRACATRPLWCSCARFDGRRPTPDGGRGRDAAKPRVASCRAPYPGRRPYCRGGRGRHEARRRGGREHPAPTGVQPAPGRDLHRAVGAHRGAVLAEIGAGSAQQAHRASEPPPQPLRRDQGTRRSRRSRYIRAALFDHAGEADFAYVHGHAEGWSGLRFRPLPTGEEPEVEHISVRLEVLRRQVLEPPTIAPT